MKILLLVIFSSIADFSSAHTLTCRELMAAVNNLSSNAAKNASMKASISWQKTIYDNFQLSEKEWKRLSEIAMQNMLEAMKQKLKNEEQETDNLLMQLLAVTKCKL